MSKVFEQAPDARDDNDSDSEHFNAECRNFYDIEKALSQLVKHDVPSEIRSRRYATKCAHLCDYPSSAIGAPTHTNRAHANIASPAVGWDA